MIKKLLRYLVRKLFRIEFTGILRYDIEYYFHRLYYIGCWSALYNCHYPRIDKFVKEFCSYYYFDPVSLAKRLDLEYKSGKSVQVKYFYYGFCENTGTWHTVIYECNVYDDFSVRWNYGQKLIFEWVKHKRKLRLIPYMRKGKPIRALEQNLGWNRHCRFYLGYDQSATQYFVIKEDTY